MVWHDRYMSSHPQPPELSEAFLPEQFIRGLKRELDAKRELYEQLPKIIDDLAKRFDAALNFAPPGFRLTPEPAESESPAGVLGDRTAPTADAAAGIDGGSEGEKVGWRKAIVILLEEAGAGMAHQDLIRLARDRFDFPPSAGEKAFYNAVGRLAKVGGIVKHGDQLFTPSVHDRLQASGQLPLASAIARRRGSSARHVLAVLRQFPDGLTGPDLREELARIPDVPRSLYEHQHYIYNVLAPMIGSGDVVKDARGFYRLAAPELNEGGRPA